MVEFNLFYFHKLIIKGALGIEHAARRATGHSSVGTRRGVLSLNFPLNFYIVYFSWFLTVFVCSPSPFELVPMALRGEP